jgi:hypothetical protein
MQIRKKGDEIKKKNSSKTTEPIIEQFWPFEEISIFSHDVILDTGRR